MNSKECVKKCLACSETEEECGKLRSIYENNGRVVKFLLRVGIKVVSFCWTWQWLTHPRFYHLKQPREDKHSLLYLCNVCENTIGNFRGAFFRFTGAIQDGIDEQLCESGEVKSEVATYLEKGQVSEASSSKVGGKKSRTGSVEHDSSSRRYNPLRRYCDLCPSEFASITQVEIHMERNHYPWLHKCEVCSKGFCEIIQLINHRRVHAGN